MGWFVGISTRTPTTSISFTATPSSPAPHVSVLPFSTRGTPLPTYTPGSRGDHLHVSQPATCHDLWKRRSAVRRSCACARDARPGQVRVIPAGRVARQPRGGLLG